MMRTYFGILSVCVLLLLSGISFAAQTLQIESSITPASISPGNSGFVTLAITNVGTGYAETLKIKSIKADSPIVIRSSVYGNSLGSLGPSKATSAIIRFDIPGGTQSGFYGMEFVIEACDSSSVCTNFVHNTIVTVQSPSALEISSFEPKSLRAGESKTLGLTLKNHGNSAINNVIITWSEANSKILPLGSDNRKFISSIAGNSQAIASIDIVVNPDATPGVYSIDFDIQYSDETGTAGTVSSSVGLMITGDFNFIVTAESQDIVAPGTGGSVTVKIANAGSQEAQFMTIRVLESYPLTGIKPGVIYVGNLESDDYDTEKFGFVVGDTTPGEHDLNVEITYKDLYGNDYSDNYSLGITVYSIDFIASQTADYSWLFYIIIIVIAYLLYRKFHKKKR